ncbi:MAG: DUF1697 domain-containing protein [Solirubrobacterales bacterium]|nr:DUF1697 domain-containing protein [Solirubrobacterales bacterium]
MTSYVALLRAVNVGGTGKLPMKELKAMCEEAGFEGVATYIASGNVVFHADDPAEKVKEILELRLADYAGKKVDVFVRTAREMRDLVDVNPFPDEPGNRVAVLFLDRSPPGDLDGSVKGVQDERFKPADREIFVHYPQGMGQSKLSFGSGLVGTARNMNTVAKLAGMAAG